MPTSSRRPSRSVIAEIRGRLRLIFDFLDPECRLALSYVGGGQREALEILWMLDASFAQLLRSTSQPIAAQVKLAWWREALIGLDRAPAPAEPLLQAISQHLPPAGLAGAELAALADGWEQLVANETLSGADLLAYGSGRGGTLFHFSARLLGCQPIKGLDEAGVGWALVDLARHSRQASEAAAALKMASAHLASAPRRWPARLRPLGMLAVLARHDAAGSNLGMPASPSRMLRMLAHRLTGR